MTAPHKRSFWKPEVWTAIFTGVLAVVTGFALIYAHQQISEMHESSRKQIAEAHEEAQIQHLVTFVNQFDQEPMASYRKILAEKRLRKEPDPVELYRVLDFFETVGVLTDRGYLNENDVYEEFSYWIFHFYADTEIREGFEFELRQDTNEYRGFQSLFRRMKAIDAGGNGKSYLYSAAEVKAFYEEESQIFAGAPTPKHAPGKSASGTSKDKGNDKN